ncbi:MAG: DNA-deoxyinosine glycosylase [Clostridia bacterium]|nr:DNA-deoxyinosine glycosylase [Clostridia bacterium]MBR1683934.1 DNA-deoxyinosine glycosylase [Clostridia bacterium]
MESQSLVHPFPPLVCPESRILILGSFPSVKSREQQFFYGHPQNRFWRLLARVYDTKVPETIEEKTALVFAHHLALWDSVGSCTVKGSSDASIRDVVPNDLSRVFSVAPIERILLNGSLSGKTYQRYLEAKTGIPGLVMPSTSPANAAFSLERLAEIWGPYLRV